MTGSRVRRACHTPYDGDLLCLTPRHMKPERHPADYRPCRVVCLAGPCAAVHFATQQRRSVALLSDSQHLYAYKNRASVETRPFTRLEPLISFLGPRILGHFESALASASARKVRIAESSPPAHSEHIYERAFCHPGVVRRKVGIDWIDILHCGPLSQISLASPRPVSSPYDILRRPACLLMIPKEVGTHLAAPAGSSRLRLDIHVQALHLPNLFAGFGVAHLWLSSSAGPRFTCELVRL